MAQIAPFQGIRYGQADLSNLVAPPYDILSEADKKALLAKHDQNIVTIDLPHVPPKTAGPDAAYDRAAGELISWLDTHHLIHDPEPAIYAYHQTFGVEGRPLTRKMFFARLRLEPFGEGGVFPHEQTFGGPKEDRLKLTIATRCNTSPIFALYPDPENQVSALLDEAIDREPDATATMDGVQNKLWAVTDSEIIAEVLDRLSGLSIFIADGHHRYETALKYQEFRNEEAEEPPDSDAPHNFVMTVLAGMQDPGATIRPYFRSIVGLPDMTAEKLEAILKRRFHCNNMRRPQNAQELAEHLDGAGPQTFALYVAKDDVCIELTPHEPDMLAALEPERHPAWRKLPYALLHRVVIDEALRAESANADTLAVHYHKSLSDAIEDAHENSGIAALMPATRMSDLRDVCAAGELMPQKSTYFYPKLATGLVINPLY